MECAQVALEHHEPICATVENARARSKLACVSITLRALHRAAANWERARRIRELVAAASDGAKLDGVSVQPGTPFGDWLIWAAQQADRIDPIKVSPPSIIDSKAAPAPHSSYYGHQKPDPPMRFPKPLWR